MYIGIAHGVGYVVRFCRTPDINLQAQADGKLIADVYKRQVPTTPSALHWQRPAKRI